MGKSLVEEDKVELAKSLMQEAQSKKCPFVVAGGQCGGGKD